MFFVVPAGDADLLMCRWWW